MGLHRDFDQLTTFSKVKLRSVRVTDFFGSVVGNDLKKHPIKVAPWFVIPAPVIPSLTVATIAACTLAMKMRSKDFRGQVRDAFKQPIHLAFYDQSLRECPKTGQTYACSLSLFGRRWRTIKNGTNFLMEYHFDKFPRHWAIDAVRDLHKRLSRYRFPAVVDQDSANKQSWQGAVFALAGLANAEPADIASYLHGRDRQLFEQEYATQEL